MTQKDTNKAQKVVDKVMMMGASFEKAKAEVMHWLEEESADLRKDFFDRVLNDDDYALALAKELQ